MNFGAEEQISRTSTADLIKPKKKISKCKDRLFENRGIKRENEKE